MNPENDPKPAAPKKVAGKKNEPQDVRCKVVAFSASVRGATCYKGAKINLTETEARDLEEKKEVVRL